MSEDKKKQGELNMSDLCSALPSNTPGLNAEDRAGLVNALKSKLQSLAGKNADVMETLSPKVRKRVEVLKKIQGQHDVFEAQFHEEKAALEAKYEKLYEPLYTKRYEIVNGLVEVENVVDVSAKNISAEDKANEVKGVPDFWLTAMRTNEVLSEEIHERDEDALKFLKDIKWSKLDDSKGFRLEFFFNSNPFFKNSLLSKAYHMVDDTEPILEKAIGTQIEWFPGKCLTQKVLKKKPKRGSKNTKPITKTEKCESFFNFFSPPLIPEDDEELGEEAAEQLQDQMEQDYDIGSTIRDKIIPHAVSWFTGEAAQEELEDMGDDEDDAIEQDDDDEDEDESEDEDDDDNEDEEVKRRKKPASGLKKVGEAQQVDRPPECKQQ